MRKLDSPLVSLDARRAMNCNVAWLWDAHPSGMQTLATERMLFRHSPSSLPLAQFAPQFTAPCGIDGHSLNGKRIY